LFATSQFLPPLAAAVAMTNCCLRVDVEQLHSVTFFHEPAQFTAGSGEVRD
jgi:hypothetical protein